MKRQLLNILWPSLDDFWKEWVLKDKTCEEHKILDKLVKYITKKEVNK